MESLPEELENRVRSELRHGERLVWTGQPIPSRVMRTYIPIALLGIPVIASAVLSTTRDSGLGGAGGGPWWFEAFITSMRLLFIVAPVLIGLGLFSFPYWMYRRARRTCYALTDQRAIVWATGWRPGTEVRSFQAADLGELARRDFADGSGDVIFEKTITRDSEGSIKRKEWGFHAIENVRDVEELIRRTLLGAR
jgi:hypothetical protein